MSMTNVVELRAEGLLPQHVPDELVIDFNFRGDIRLEPDMHRGLATFLGGPNLFYTPRNGGHWVTVKHPVIMDILRDAETFSATDSNLPPSPGAEKKYPLELDPPAHGKWRRYLTPLLAKRVVTQLEHSTVTIVNKMIDDVLSDGGCEFATTFGNVVPAHIFMTMMGLPTQDFDMFRGWAWDVMHSKSTEEKGRVYGLIVGYLQKLIVARRETPQEDILTAIATAEIDGELAPIEEARSMCLMLFLGGFDTTANAMGFAINHLARYPADRQALIDDPELIPQAIEELLRRYGFSTGIRTATRDLEFHGIQLCKGDPVMMYTSITGLDEKLFEDPFKVDFKRGRAQHLAFGGGVHFCPGAHLARLELHMFLREWLRRIPQFGIKPGTQTVMRAGNVIGIDHLELAWPSA